MFRWTPRTGNKFDEWCQKYGRTRPSQDVIDALNTDIVTGTAAVKEQAKHQNLQSSNVYKDFVTFASGKGQQ